MRRLVLLSALAMASAPAASAQTTYYRDRDTDRERNPDACRIGRDRYDGGYYDRDGRMRDWRSRSRWVPIAERSSATTERQFINVAGRGGRFRCLLVEGVRGAPVIERVAVEFENRRTQVWDLNRRLMRGADEVIDLGGPRRIRRIIVYTEPARRGVYSIYGA
jgi:hypothetical protein